MRFNVIFIKKKYIYYFTILVIIILLSLILLFSKKTTRTFHNNMDNINSTTKSDFNNDGTEDKLYISTNDNKYQIKVLIKKNSLYLEPDVKLPTLGSYSSYWPIKALLVDVTRNKSPEIFIQSSSDNAAISHIFL